MTNTKYSPRNFGTSLKLAGLAALVAVSTGCATIKSQGNPYVIYGAGKSGQGKMFPHWGVKRGGDAWYVNVGKMALHGLMIWGGKEGADYFNNKNEKEDQDYVVPVTGSTENGYHSDNSNPYVPPVNPPVNPPVEPPVNPPADQGEVEFGNGGSDGN